MFAGFLTHTDAQIGRLVDRLERVGVLDNTVVMFLSDNGAQCRGRPLGTVNEHRFTSQQRRDVEDNLARLDELGRVPRVQPLRLGLGVGRQHAVPAVEALHVARRHARAA